MEKQLDQGEMVTMFKITCLDCGWSIVADRPNMECTRCGSMNLLVDMYEVSV